MIHEQQQGQLCAQHALNNLLQGNYFTAVDLAEIARELDASENNSLSIANPEPQNYDDTGYFSIQVLTIALQVWNLQLLPISSIEATEAKSNPTKEYAFICNLDNHWFTLRRFGSKKLWYNLNSLQNQPEFITDSYLGLLLAQLQNDNYSIFVVRGQMPQCDADEEVDYSSQILYQSNSSKFNSLDSSDEVDLELQKAIANSMGNSMEDSENGDEELELQKALDFSLGKDFSSTKESEFKVGGTSNPVDLQQLRDQRLKRSLG